MTKLLQTRTRVMYSGFDQAESPDIRIADQLPMREALLAPRWADCFCYYDQLVASVIAGGRELTHVLRRSLNASPWYFIDARVLSQDEAYALDDSKFYYDLMHRSGCDTVILCRSGLMNVVKTGDFEIVNTH